MAGGSRTDAGTAVDLDYSGNCYLTGTTGRAASFDSLILNSGGLFIANYSSAGNIVWAKHELGYEASPSAIAIDQLGQTYITGIAADHLTSIPYIPISHIFIAKYNATGTLVWDKRIIGISQIQVLPSKLTA